MQAANRLPRVRIDSAGFAFKAYGPTDHAELRVLGDAVLTRLAPLLDCRRRAARGSSPSGEIVFTYRVTGTRLSRPRLVSSSVANSGATMCVARALRLHALPTPIATQAARVRFNFHRTIKR